MPDLPRPDHYRFVMLTSRDPEHDFRIPLLQALRRRHPAWSVWLRRRPMISGPGDADAPRQVSIPALLRFMRHLPGGGTPVYLNSTNTYFPGFSLLLRRIAERGIWCYDMHDDLRYHNQGLARLREEATIHALCRTSHLVVHASPSLGDLFPDSVHLGNASHLAPLDLSNADRNDVLVLASFDERFDAAYMSAVARLCPEFRFHMHGWTRPDDRITRGHILGLVAAHPNIRYHGGYTMRELPAILSRYRISLAPYDARSELTRYIDPLRFYHCLNAGLEVISTPIPQARYMGAFVHVAADARACREALLAVRAGTARKQASYRPITWAQRADRLMELVGEIRLAGAGAPSSADAVPLTCRIGRPVIPRASAPPRGPDDISP